MIQVNLISMKFEFIFLMISFYIKDGNYQRLTPKEMKDVIETVVQLNFDKADYDEAIKCWSIQQEKSFPHIQYAYQWCLLRNDDQPEVINYPNSYLCPGSDCWESQLTDVTRFEIINIMNTYRQKVADGSCIDCEYNEKRTIIELKWASYLEKIAAESVQHCSTINYGLNTIDEIDYNNHPKFNQFHMKTNREIAIVSFATHTGLQREIRLILWNLMANNHLNDWTSNGQFRRNGVTDVGCAYVITRNVSLITALNENVTNGNVGYLSCVYDTPYDKNRYTPLNYAEIPSLKSCENILAEIVTPNKIAFGQPLNYYYPSLCHILTNEVADQSHIFCERLESQNSICINPKYEINKKTWQEKLYGIKLMTSADFSKKILQCNIPKNLPLPERQQSETIFNYNCTLKKELFVNANPQLCSNWTCTDSQLTDITKVRILKFLNTARHAIAMGKCPPECELLQMFCSNKTYCNIANLQWHWFLELKANQIVQSCPDAKLIPEIFDDGPFKGPIVYEKIGVMFELPMNEGQLALETAFSQLFWTNGFQDWSIKTKEFERGNALYIGCAAVFRPNITLNKTPLILKLKDGITTHLVCIFAALSDRFFTTPGKPDDESCCQKCQHDLSLTNICEANHVKNVQPFPNLCTSNIFEITMSCEVNPNEFCSDGSKSKAWELIYNGSTVYQKVSGEFQKKERYTNHSIFQSKWPGWLTCSFSEPSTTTFKLPATAATLEIESYYKKKYCRVLIFFFLMLIALLAMLISLLFKYSVEKKIFEES